MGYAWVGLDINENSIISINKRLKYCMGIELGQLTINGPIYTNNKTWKDREYNKPDVKKDIWVLVWKNSVGQMINKIKIGLIFKMTLDKFGYKLTDAGIIQK